MPVTFFYVFEIFWLDYVGGKFAGSLRWTLLEIIPPKDIEMSPKPMESIYQGLVGVVVGFTTFDKYLKGAFTDQFTFELAGIGGEVHFFVRIQTKYRNLVESQIYAQYPDAEIVEVEDYVQNYPKVVPNKDWDVWGTDVELTKPDAYPIRTYDKFEESVTGTMIDPVASFVELMGTLPPGQNLWMQLIVEPLPEDWMVAQKKEVEKLAGRIAKKSGGLWQDLVDVFTNLFAAMSASIVFGKKAEKEQAPLAFRLTPGENEVLKALEENLGKNAFKVKFRVLYLGQKKGFDKSYISAFFGSMRQFNDLNLNGMKPSNESKTYANYLFIEPRLQMRKRKIYNRYRDRDASGKRIVFSTSELATVFHFPDFGVKTPSLSQVASKRGYAPPNLPVQ